MSVAQVCCRVGFLVARRRFAISLAQTPRRLYASRSNPGNDSESKMRSKRTAISTDSFIPGSKIRIAEEAQAEYHKCEEKMTAAVEWYRREVASLENRAVGRVTPALLSPVRVVLPSRGNDPLRLDEIATVGVKDNSLLIVTVFEEDSLKYVESALYDAKLPGIIPQRADSRTIRIQIPRPTVDARTSLQIVARREAENVRVQLRKLHQASLKKGKYAKHSPEIDEFQKLTDTYVGQVDKILAEMKTNLK